MWRTTVSNIHNSIVTKCVWNPDLSDQFLTSLERIADTLCDTIDNIVVQTEPERVNNGIKEFTDMITNVAAPYFHKTHRRRQHTQQRKDKPPYYTLECENKRTIFLEYLNRYRATGSDSDRRSLCDARRVFKNSVRNCRLDYDRSRTHELLRAKHQNARLYWRLLKGNKTRRTTPNIDNTNVYNYFESLYVPQYDINVVDDDVNEVINGEMDIIIYLYKIAIPHHGMQSFHIIVYCTPVYCTPVYCMIVTSRIYPA